MKPSIHLIYGIVIGMLLFACTGSDSTSNTATPTSSGVQKQFKKIVLAEIDSNSEGDKTDAQKALEGDSCNLYIAGEKVYEGKSKHDCFAELQTKGYTIIDWQLDAMAYNTIYKVNTFLVGK
jgi:hypothetical protein